MDLFKTDYFFKQINNPTDQVYCDYYDIDFPMQKFLQLRDEGKASTHRDLDVRVITGMGSAPDDIVRIDVKLEDIAVKAIPNAIMAETTEDFEAVKSKTIQDLLDANAETSRTWWQNKHNEVREKLGI